MKINNKNGYTLLEIVVVCFIILILSVGGSQFLYDFIVNVYYISDKMQVDKVAYDAINTLIHGDDRFNGIHDGTFMSYSSTQFIYASSDSKLLNIYLDNGCLYYVNLVTPAENGDIPKYANSGVYAGLCAGSNDSDPANIQPLFQYFDNTDTEIVPGTGVPASDIYRIQFNPYVSLDNSINSTSAYMSSSVRLVTQ